jgi:pseudouridine-5'-phosphate glycosidase
LKPLVALESSVLAQGLPYPHNLEAAERCQAAVREEGAVPATLAVIDGELWVGLDQAQLERLATGQGLMKVGSRDLPLAVARRATGGTTVSATCELAAAAGIHVFATGGLGGVHRGV